MHDQRADQLIKIANEKLDRAIQETERSAEDVVTHMLCSHSRDAISKFMQGFLLKHDVMPFEPMTLAGLLEQCKEIDARFESVDLSNIHCRFETHDRDYCLERNQVDMCMVVAKHMRGIVMNAVPGF